MIKVMQFIFGTNPKQIFKRVLIVALMILLSAMLMLNAGCGIKFSGFSFEWKPINVEIKKNL